MRVIPSPLAAPLLAGALGGLFLSALSLSALSLSGCGDTPGYCDFPEPRADLPVRAVAVGTSGYRDYLDNAPSSGFEAYPDGGETRLIAGAQGGYMLQPAIRVEALPGDPDELCVAYRVSNASPDAEVTSGFEIAVRLARDGDFFYSQPVDDFLSFNFFELEGAELTLEVTVVGETFQGSESVTLTLLPAT